MYIVVNYGNLFNTKGLKMSVSCIWLVGPTVAQAKPKAIALAGPGGVAAAAPVGTALVGPGGMALSAPEATAVAGVKGASSGVVSPATTKQATKAIRTYQLANHNLSYLLKNGF